MESTHEEKAWAAGIEGDATPGAARERKKLVRSEFRIPAVSASRLGLQLLRPAQRFSNLSERTSWMRILVSMPRWQANLIK